MPFLAFQTSFPGLLMASTHHLSESGRVEALQHFVCGIGSGRAPRSLEEKGGIARYVSYVVECTARRHRLLLRTATRTYLGFTIRRASTAIWDRALAPRRSGV